MAKFYLIRHGAPNYSYAEKNSFIGYGFDLSPLDSSKIEDVLNTVKDERLEKAQVIISSPYTRALQTAAIISRITNKEIVVEMDLMEWRPDLTYQYRNRDEMHELYEDYISNNGIYPNGESRKWEDKESLKNRVQKVLEKYKCYDNVIVVAHNMAIQSICNCGELKPAQIVELIYE